MNVLKETITDYRFSNEYNKWRWLGNLVKRGVYVASNMCCFSGGEEDTINHIFFTCDYARAVWNWLMSWSSIFPFSPTFVLYLIRMLYSV